MRTSAQKPKATQHTRPAKPTTLDRADLGRSLDANSIIHVQRMIANRSAQRLLGANLGDVERSVAIGLTHFGHDFSRIPVRAAIHGHSAHRIARKVEEAASLAPIMQEVPAPLQSASTEPVIAPENAVSGTVPNITTLPRQVWQKAKGWFPHSGSIIQRKCSCCATEEDEVQAKLPVSEPNDPLEQEADRFAERVMQALPPTVSRGAAPAVRRDVLDDAVQQVEAISEEEETRPRATRPGTAMAKRRGTGPLTLPVNAIPRNGGRSLEPEVQHFFSERTGLDFAHVRIHADAEAATSASRLAARAYTVGSNIYFGRGEYEPRSREGRTLLAHELAHVVQQSQEAQPRMKAGQLRMSAAPPSVLRQSKLLPPGNCIQGIHDGMQRAVKQWCDHPFGRACTAGESCLRLLQKIRRNQMCAHNRWVINRLCYNGGDAGHIIAERDARNAQATCMALYRAQCQPRPLPRPERAPVRAPERAPEVDRGFMERMAVATGLTGTALIVYLIISEGSRIFPPRNLIPVP
jgi:Domain of unknown function (DUF4157)/Novel toxin 16